MKKVTYESVYGTSINEAKIDYEIVKNSIFYKQLLSDIGIPDIGQFSNELIKSLNLMIKKKIAIKWSAPWNILTNKNKTWYKIGNPIGTKIKGLN